jgi:hypothetical protein
MINRYICTFLLTIAFCHAHEKKDSSQTRSKLIHVGFGVFSLKSDLSREYKIFTPGYIVAIRYFKKKWINGSLNFNYFRVISENYESNWNEFSAFTPANFVKTEVFSGEYTLVLNLIKTSKHNFFLAQGLGIAYFQPYDSERKRLIDKPNTRNRGEDFNNISFTLPTFLGYQFLLNKQCGFLGQIKWLRQQSDYFDNLSQLSLKKVKDNVLSIQLSFSYLFNNQYEEIPLDEYRRVYRNKKYRISLK